MPLPSFLGPFVDLPVASADEPGSGQPAGPTGTPHILPFAMQTQEQTKWCWAATTASVSAYYEDDPPLSQCQVATDCLGMDCCVTPLPPAGNAMYALDAALNRVHHLEGREAIERPLSFSEIKTEIDAKRPVCCHISSEHFNVIVGYYDDDKETVHVRDPFYGGEHPLPYETFVNNYYGGSWNWSYRTVDKERG